jgi:hypothetical protein
MRIWLLVGVGGAIGVGVVAVLWLAVRDGVRQAHRRRH